MSKAVIDEWRHDRLCLDHTVSLDGHQILRVNLAPDRVHAVRSVDVNGPLPQEVNVGRDNPGEIGALVLLEPALEAFILPMKILEVSEEISPKVR
jgi:hypothetical protein